MHVTQCHCQIKVVWALGQYFTPKVSESDSKAAFCIVLFLITLLSSTAVLPVLVAIVSWSEC